MAEVVKGTVFKTHMIFDCPVCNYRTDVIDDKRIITPTIPYRCMCPKCNNVWEATITKEQYRKEQIAWHKVEEARILLDEAKEVLETF